MTRSRLFIALGLLAVALTVTSIAFAAPKKGLWLSKLKSASSYGEGSGVWRVASGPSIRNGRQLRYIILPSNFKCGNPVPAKNKIPIRNGKFAYVGAGLLNPGEKPLHKGKLTWTGRFTTRKKVKGTIRFQSPVTPKQTNDGIKYQKKKCDTGTLRWVGKYDGPA